jgi:outer membrane protein assembly factor BamB
MYLNRLTAVAFSLVLLTSVSIHADQHWLNWRGTQSNGNAADGDYPTSWSEENNIHWKISIPGRGGSTPIVVGKKIFLTAGIDGQNSLVAYDMDGKTLWTEHLGTERAGKHKKGSGSNSSPVSDGQFVYAYFKSGDLGCFDLAGKIIWKRNLQVEYGEDTLWWDLGTSPILTKEAVVVAVMQSGPSFIVAFDKKSGQQLWKVDRMLNVNGESNQAYTTPVVHKTDDGDVLFALGADHVTAHDANSGKELWRVGGFNPTDEKNFRSIASPVIAGDLILCPYARGQLLTGVRYQSGLSEKERSVWQREKIAADVPSPTVIGDRAFVMTDKGEVSCIESSSGKTLWSGTLPKSRLAFSSSPILAGGHLYLVREDATTFVLKAGAKFEVIAENTLDSTTVATPVFVDGKIYLRTFDALYCISKPTPAR